MKTSIIILSVLLSNIASAQTGNLHQFKVKSLEGEDFDMATLKGKKVMIVNVASKCGLTPQYEELQKLYNLYNVKNFVIIGFPANNFLSQEPGTAEEIREFCSRNYGVSFPMMEKISVKGKDMHPLYKWLTSKEFNGVLESDVQWNFQKYLIDENGNLVDMIPPKQSPMSEEIVKWIEGE